MAIGKPQECFLYSLASIQPWQEQAEFFQGCFPLEDREVETKCDVFVTIVLFTSTQLKRHHRDKRADGQTSL